MVILGFTMLRSYTESERATSKLSNPSYNV
jgi:hypothetical protein